MLLRQNKFMTSSFSWLALPLTGAILLGMPMSLKAQEVLPEESSAEIETPDDLRVQTNVLSMSGGERLLQEASSAVSAQNYDLAETKLQEARQVFNQLSNFYQQLSSSFTGVDNRIAEANRTNALSAAEMRDQATYQLALVHRAQNQPELAVPLLVQIIGSQSPTRDLGEKAYQQLFEMGFVDDNYPRTSASSSEG